MARLHTESIFYLSNFYMDCHGMFLLTFMVPRCLILMTLGIQKWEHKSVFTHPVKYFTAIKFCTDLHGSQKMNPSDTGDLLTFPATMRLTVVLLSEMSQQLSDELPWNVAHTFMSLTRCSPQLFNKDFHQFKTSAILWFMTKYLHKKNPAFSTKTCIHT